MREPDLFGDDEMSRIRSVHPGLWTDERFVSVSPLARLLFIGIWNECDDQGSFAWSPVTIKMRLLPADNCDASDLLDELVASGSIMRYEIDGRHYGAVRNFTRYQRPKKPNSIHPQTDEVRNWCGTPLAEEGGRREDEGGRRERGGARARLPDDFVPVLTDAAKDVAERIGKARFERELQRFKDHHRGKGSTMADWQAAFRTWLSRCEEYGGRGNGAGKPSGWLQ